MLTDVLLVYCHFIPIIHHGCSCVDEKRKKIILLNEMIAARTFSSLMAYGTLILVPYDIVYRKDIIRNTYKIQQKANTIRSQIVFSYYIKRFGPYQQLISPLQTFNMVTTRSASKRKLDLLEAAPLILANECRACACACARAQKPSNAKGERVRKQQLHAVAPQEDQPVSARLRSATRKTQGDESSIDTRPSASKVKTQDVDQKLYEPVPLNLRHHLQDAESSYEKVLRVSTKRRKSWLVSLGYYCTSQRTVIDASIIIYSILKTTQISTSENDCDEPKEPKKSVSFRDRALVDEVLFYHDDPPEQITEPDLYEMPSFPCPPVENKLPSSRCKEQKKRKGVTFCDHALVDEVIFHRDDTPEQIAVPDLYGVPSPVIEEVQQPCIDTVECTSETFCDHSVVAVTEAFASRNDPSEPIITDFNNRPTPLPTGRRTLDVLTFKTLLCLLGMSVLTGHLVEYVLANQRT
jgi:hypothetical protein